VLDANKDTLSVLELIPKSVTQPEEVNNLSTFIFAGRPDMQDPNIDRGIHVGVSVRGGWFGLGNQVSTSHHG